VRGIRPYRKFCAASGRCHDVIPPNRTAKLKQFAGLLQSGERNSRMSDCAGEHSSDGDFKVPRIGSAQPGRFGRFQPARRS
jgi:hypothetical protein